MDAGAFTDLRVIDAARPFMRVLANCTSRKEGDWALMRRYGAKVFPTIVYLDPAGDVVELVTGLRDAEDVRDTLVRLWDRFIPKPERLRALLARVPDFEAWITKRMRQLEDGNLETRDSAATDLRSLKAALETALAIAAESQDADVRARAQDLLRPPERKPPVIVPVRP